MDDSQKSKEQLLEEISQLRERIAFLEGDIPCRESVESMPFELQRNMTAFNKVLLSLLDRTHLMIAYLDSQFNFLWVNNAYAHAGKKEPDFFLGKNHFELYPHKENEQIFKKVIETGQPYYVKAKPFEYPDQPERGVTYWDWSLVPVFHDHEKVKGLVFSLVEVTDRILIEQSLTESEERYRLVAENASDNIWILSLDDLKFTYISPSCLNMFGFTQEESLAMDFAEHMPGEAILSMQELLAEELEKDYQPGVDKHRSRVIELEQYVKGGGTIWTEIQASFIRDENGKPVSVLGITRDITSRKLTEDTLRHEKELSEEIINSLPGLFYIFDEHSFVRWNKEWLDISGYTDEELANKYGTDFFEGADREVIGQKMLEVFQKGSAVSEAAFITKDGRKIPYIFTGKKKIIDGKAYLIGLGVDISLRKQVEEELRKFRTISDAAAHGNAIADVNGTLIYVNEYFAKIHGYSPGEMFGQHINILYPDAEMPKVNRIIDEMLQEGSFSSKEVLHIHKDGTEFPMLMSGIVLFDENNKPRFIAASAIDITERKKAEEEKILLEEQLLQAQKMESIGRLAGGVAHDFNNLLTAIIGYSELIEASVDSQSPLHKDVKEIIKAADTASQLTSQLLTFSRKQTINPKIVDINETVEHSKKMLERLIEENIDLVFIPDVNLWKVKVDPGQLEQVLVNLTVNARDAMPNGGRLTISTANVFFNYEQSRQHRLIKEGEYVILTVTDEGCGIDKDTLEFIFDPFFTTKIKGKGTGLGLSTVYGIVKQHDGYIDVFTEPDKGTSFNVYFPRAFGEADIIFTLPEEEKLSGSETILLVEDERTVRHLAERILVSNGYRVFVAENGNKAETIFQEHQNEIQVLLTDVMMPGMNGKELSIRIRNAKPETKVLFMSGYTEETIAHRGVLEEGTPFIQKPFKAKKLLQKVREVIDY